MGSKKRKKNAGSGKISFCVSENFMICTIFCIFNNKISIDNSSQNKYAQKMLNYVHSKY